jgi:hypothetical protein
MRKTSTFLTVAVFQLLGLRTEGLHDIPSLTLAGLGGVFGASAHGINNKG